jgi:hypothetical protein
MTNDACVKTVYGSKYLNWTKLVVFLFENLNKSSVNLNNVADKITVSQSFAERYERKKPAVADQC